MNNINIDKIKKINELKDQIKRQLLLYYYLTKNEEILLLINRL